MKRKRLSYSISQLVALMEYSNDLLVVGQKGIERWMENGADYDYGITEEDRQNQCKGRIYEWQNIRNNAQSYARSFDHPDEKVCNRVKQLCNRILHRGLKIMVTTYDYTRAYGGPEEGGWYYDAYSYPQVREAASYEAAKAMRDALNDEAGYAYNRKGDRYKVQSHLRESQTFIEFFPNENLTTRTPHYC